MFVAESTTINVSNFFQPLVASSNKLFLWCRTWSLFCWVFNIWARVGDNISIDIFFARMGFLFFAWFLYLALFWVAHSIEPASLFWVTPLLSWALFWVAHSIEPSFEQNFSIEHSFEQIRSFEPFFERSNEEIYSREPFFEWFYSFERFFERSKKRSSSVRTFMLASYQFMACSPKL